MRHAGLRRAGVDASHVFVDFLVAGHFNAGRLFDQAGHSHTVTRLDTLIQGTPQTLAGVATTPVMFLKTRMLSFFPGGLSKLPEFGYEIRYLVSICAARAPRKRASCFFPTPAAIGEPRAIF